MAEAGYLPGGIGGVIIFSGCKKEGCRKRRHDTRRKKNGQTDDQQCGNAFLYLAGEVSEDGAIGIHWTDSYQRPLDFYERVRELRAEISDKVDLEIFCVLGVSKKVDGIEAFVEGQIKERVLEICGEPGREGKGIRTDRLEADFNRLI